MLMKRLAESNHLRWKTAVRRRRYEIISAIPLLKLHVTMTHANIQTISRPERKRFAIHPDYTLCPDVHHAQLSPLQKEFRPEFRFFMEQQRLTVRDGTAENESVVMRVHEHHLIAPKERLYQKTFPDFGSVHALQFGRTRRVSDVHGFHSF
jgi:hypothetical protein